MKPRVSIIMPCYNQARYLSDAVESVVAQTFKGWELIIVNDGSLDSSLRKAEALVKKHTSKTIRVLTIENGGLSNARNVGIRSAQAGYILPLDADDKLHKDFLKKTVAILDSKKRVDVVNVNAVRFGSKRDKIVGGELALEKVVVSNQLNYCSLYRKKVWVDAGGYNPNMKYGYEDWDFWVSCAERGFKSYCVNEYLFLKRFKKESMFTDAIKNDVYLKAQMVVNHQRVYDQDSIDFAKEVLSRLPDAKSQLFTPNMQKVQKLIMKTVGKAGRDHFRLGEMFFAMGNNRKAKEHFTQVKKKELSSRELFRFLRSLGIVLMHSGQKQKGYVYVRQAIALIMKKGDFKIIDHYSLGSLYKMINDHERARKHFQYVVRHTVDLDQRCGAYFHLGELCLIQKQRKKSEKMFSACCAINSRHLKARKYLDQLQMEHSDE